MLTIREVQMDALQHEMMLKKLEGAMSRAVADFAALSRPSRRGFLEESLAAASKVGLETEQGLASYVLGAWFLEPGFEARSRFVQALLQSHFPEVRKVYAMNEWLHTLLGAPADMAAADEVLKAAFYRTAAWGA